MTRVAFVGNSHLEAYKDALPFLTETYPQATFHFFGVANPVFFRSDVQGGSALRLAQPLDEAPNQMTTPDGDLALDLAEFDLVLLASHSFFLPPLVSALAQVDVIGFPEQDKDLPLVSMACVEDMIRARIRPYFRRIHAFFGPLENGVVVQAPFPVPAFTDHDPAFKRLYNHGARDAIFEAFQNILHQTSWREAIPVFPVPSEVLEVPFFTKDAFGRHRTIDSSADIHHSDYVHANGLYAEHTLPRLLDEMLSAKQETKTIAGG